MKLKLQTENREWDNEAMSESTLSPSSVRIAEDSSRVRVLIELRIFACRSNNPYVLKLCYKYVCLVISNLIADKIKRCKTDSFVGLEYDNAERPECNNLLSVYQIVSGKTNEEVIEECEDMSWGTFKPLLTDAVVEHLSPIQVRYHDITAESAYLDKVLSEGADRATEIAEVTVHSLKQAMGFYI
ncbi:hypothetical protein Rs2_16972 [Raphanus sativus]|nr:hypothetical protein Rs2_16972 [Raphanus sativus]